jgi:hypothetical protein
MITKSMDTTKTKPLPKKRRSRPTKPVSQSKVEHLLPQWAPGSYDGHLEKVVLTANERE